MADAQRALKAACTPNRAQSRSAVLAASMMSLLAMLLASYLGYADLFAAIRHSGVQDSASH